MRMAGGRRWGIAVVTVWALLLLVAAVWSAHHDQATVRAQSDLTAGRQTLDEAVAAVLAAAGTGVGVDVQPYEVATGCRVTLARSGTEIDQTVLLTVPAGQEGELLDRLVDRLPAGWQAQHFPRSNRFFADAGNFVAVRAEVGEPGQVRLTASTGCRPGSEPELAPD
jgi:hypothetical protein